MKNKRLIIILSIFTFLTLVIVLSSTVFVANSFEVKWLTTTSRFSPSDNENIIESANFKQNESVFLFDKQKYVTALEKENPYLKVVKLEISFPNKIILHLAEREVLYALNVTKNQGSENTYVLLDDELKVLEIAQITNAQLYNLSYNILEFVNLPVMVTDFEVGSKVDALASSEVLVEFGLTLKSYFTAKTAQLQNPNISLQIREFIKKVYISFGTSNQVLISTDWGIYILIDDASHNLFEKLVHGIDVFEELRDDYVNIGAIKVLWVNGEPVGYYNANASEYISHLLG